MMKRVASLAAALAVTVFVAAAFAADNPAKAPASNSTVTGTLSKASADSITVTDSTGKDRVLTISKDAKVTCDGKDCKLADIKTGTAVTVTLNADHKDQADKIDAKTNK